MVYTIYQVTQDYILQRSGSIIILQYYTASLSTVQRRNVKLFYSFLGIQDFKSLIKHYTKTKICD